MDPKYFLHDLTLSEAEDYIKGQNRRYRQSWEQTRMMCSYMVGVMTGEDPEIELPWDDEQTEEDKKQDAEREAQEWAQMKAWCKQYNEQNSKANGTSNTLADTVHK